MLNIKVLLYLCENEKYDLLKEVLEENKDKLNTATYVSTDTIEKYIKASKFSSWMSLNREFDSTIDALAWFSIINDNFELVDILLNLDFFNDYKLMKNSFFIASCKNYTDLLDKLIHLGFNYTSSFCKFGKNKEEDCCVVDYCLGACLSRYSEKSIKYLLDLPNTTVYNFTLSMISIATYERDDILRKLLPTESIALEYVEYLKNNDSDVYDKAIERINKIYN